MLITQTPKLFYCLKLFKTILLNYISFHISSLSHIVLNFFHHLFNYFLFLLKSSTSKFVDTHKDVNWVQPNQSSQSIIPPSEKDNTCDQS